MLENNKSRGKGIQLTLWDQPWLSILERCPTYTGSYKKLQPFQGSKQVPSDRPGQVDSLIGQVNF